MWYVIFAGWSTQASKTMAQESESRPSYFGSSVVRL